MTTREGVHVTNALDWLRMVREVQKTISAAVISGGDVPILALTQQREWLEQAVECLKLAQKPETGRGRMVDPTSPDNWIGKWPGDESDEQVDAALKEMS